jgi:hypothetical protein
MGKYRAFKRTCAGGNNCALPEGRGAHVHGDPDFRARSCLAFSSRQVARTDPTSSHKPRKLADSVLAFFLGSRASGKKNDLS